MKHIIFDLDLTLVDSTIAEEARSHRNWPLVYSLIPQFVLYEGMSDVFDHIRMNGNKVAIVSTSPAPYVQRVISYFNIPVDVVVGYHDAIRKPSPAGMLLAMERMGSNISNTVSFGDRLIDIQASNTAGIVSAACLWGSKERNLLTSSSAAYVLDWPLDILKII